MKNIKHSAPRKPGIPAKRKAPVRRQLRPWGYSLPAMILIAMIVLFPILYTGYISLTNMNLYHWTDYSLVGADNYKRALLKVDSGFLSALGTTIVWTAVNMVLDTAIAYGLAAALNTQGLKAKRCLLYTSKKPSPQSSPDIMTRIPGRTIWFSMRMPSPCCRISWRNPASFPRGFPMPTW